MTQIVVIAALWLVFLWSLWKGKEIPVPYLLLLLLALTLCHSTFFIDYRNLSNLFIRDDFPKYFTYTTENLHQLLAYGSPFGFNHYFQGGIPSFYLTTCFLELLPFASILGDAMGYQVMVIFFIALIPMALFFLAREITTDGEVAQILALASTSQLGLWPLLYFGMIPALVAMPIAFFSIFFFLKYLSDKRYSFGPLIFFTGLLAYTHIVIWADTMAILLLISAARWIQQKKLIATLKKLALFGLFHILAGLPLWFVLFSYRHFLRTDWLDFKEMSVSHYLLSVPGNFFKVATLRNVFFLSVLFLVWFSLQSGEEKAKKILRQALLFSFFVLLLLSLRDAPRIQFFFQKISWAVVPFVFAFNLSLAFMFKMKKGAKIVGVLIVALLLLKHFPPQTRKLETIASMSEIDHTISSFVQRGDYALFENCSHLIQFEQRNYDHWLGYLQKDLGIKFFSHQGNDAHPFNALRSMYLVNGLFKGKPLGKANKAEFIAHLQDWSVNKICVWSPTARRFFDSSSKFKFLGDSEKYHCYEATYNIRPEVRLRSGQGRIVNETPFSFTVDLTGAFGMQMVTINKNYFKFWSARDENDHKVSLKSCGPKICFETKTGGYVHFTYRKNIWLYLIALLVFPLSWILEFVRPRPFFKKIMPWAGRWKRTNKIANRNRGQRGLLSRHLPRGCPRKG